MAKAIIKDGKLILPNEKIVIKPNPRSVKEMFGSTEHEASFMYTGASQSWELPVYESGRWVDIFKDEDAGVMEQMEKILDMNLDSRKKDCDLTTGKYMVRLFKDAPDLDLLKMELNLSIPEDYLKYLFMKVQPDVIDSEHPYADLKEYRWLIHNIAIENKSSARRNEEKTFVSGWLYKNRDNAPALYRLLLLSGQVVSNKPDTIDLFNKISDMIETGSEMVKKFRAVIEDKDAGLKMLVKDASRAGIITYKTYNFYDKNGVKLGSTDDVVKMLKDVENTKFKQELEAEVKAYKEANNILV